MMNGKIIRALDVGYGNVKFVLNHNKVESPVSCAMFPSRAPAAAGAKIGEGTLNALNTVVVKVKDLEYEVGYDVQQVQGANDVTLSFDDKFVRDDSYMARVLGALHYMFKEIEGNYIDVLVVGLPVNNMSAQKDYLKNILIGKHTLPDNKVIEIKDVRVFEQPLGAFFNFMYSPQEEIHNLTYETVKSQRNLIIDPGMFTFDWLLIDNMKGNSERSGMTSKAMSAAITRIASEVRKAQGETSASVAVEYLNIIEKAIRTKTRALAYGKDLNLDKFLHYGKAVVNESVNAMAHKVGAGADIDNIILVGGGADFFLDAIQDKFKRHKIITTENSVYANVIGFQLAGEAYYLRDQVIARKTAINA